MPAIYAQRSTQIGLVAAVVLATCAGATAALADTAAPTLEINWSVDGGPINRAVPAGEGNGDGSYTYEGASVDPGTGLVLDFDLTGDPSLLISGNLSLENDLDETIEVFAEVNLAKSAPLPDGSLLAGLCAVGLTTGPGGGQLSALPPYLWQALADGSAAGPSASMFADPFFVAHSGAGSSGVSSHFGHPDPVTGPAVATSFGFELNFTLTPFDAASITSTFTAAGELSTCEGDLNGDGEIGIEDFADLLAAWGPCPAEPEPCPADLDGDRMVRIMDFLRLLALWGPCP